MPSDATSPGTPPREAISFFRAKGWKISFDYRDTWREEHAIAFTVAKATTIDLLQDIRQAVDEAITMGQPFREFANHLTPVLQEKGWWGRKAVVDPKTGTAVEAQLGSPRRLQTIYRANIRSAMAAGQWDRAQKVKRALPYFLYQLGPSKHHRQDHASLEGLVLPVDDPFWNTHFPPNGWGCKCWVRQISEAARDGMVRNGVPSRGTPEMDQQGRPTGRTSTRQIPAKTRAPPIVYRDWLNQRTGQIEKVPEGIDPGWDTNPGRDRLRFFSPHFDPSLTPGLVSSASVKSPLPKPRKWTGDEPAKTDGFQNPSAAMDGFLRRFGADQGQSILFIDATETPIPIGPALFTNKKSGSLKSQKNDRDLYLPLLEKVIKDPDEIWVRWERKGKSWRLKRSYLARFIFQNGRLGGLGIFTMTTDGWSGATLFPPHTDNPDNLDAYLELERKGLLLYRRKE